MIIRKICLIAAIFTFLWHFVPLRAEAQSVFLPFGGPIATVVPCNTGLWITIGPPNPGSFMIMPKTLIYLYRVFLPDVLTLGLYDPVPVPCVVGVLPPVGIGFDTIMIGTSVAPAPAEEAPIPDF